MGKYVYTYIVTSIMERVQLEKFGRRKVRPRGQGTVGNYRSLLRPNSNAAGRFTGKLIQSKRLDIYTEIKAVES